MNTTRMFVPSDFIKDGGSVALTVAPWAVLGAIPPAFWLSLLSILVTAYFRHQDIKLRREDIRLRNEERERLERLERSVKPPPAE